MKTNNEGKYTPTVDEILDALNEKSWPVKQTEIYDTVTRAVNSHEALLHACRRAFYLIKEGGFTHPMTEEFYDDTLGRLEKAITNAGGALTNPKDGE